MGRLCPFAPAEKRSDALKHRKNIRVPTASKGKVTKAELKRKAHKGAKKAFYKGLEDAYKAAPVAEEAADEE